MATKRTFSCGTNAGYPEEARWAPMPAWVANQNAADRTGNGGWVLWHGSRTKKVANHEYQTFILAFESHKPACIPFLILLLRKERSGKNSLKVTKRKSNTANSNLHLTRS